MNQFTVTREGVAKRLVQTFDTKRQAFTSVGYSIVDNGYGTKAEAQKFAATILLGTPATFGPFTFTVSKAGKS